MMFTRRRRKSLREEVLSSKKNILKNRIEDPDLDLAVNNGTSSRENHEANIFLSNPTSYKGSFLRNKLENPLFRSSKFTLNAFKKSKLHISLHGNGSTLKHVQNASDLDEDESESYGKDINEADRNDSDDELDHYDSELSEHDLDDDTLDTDSRDKVDRERIAVPKGKSLPKSKSKSKLLSKLARTPRKKPIISDSKRDRSRQYRTRRERKALKAKTKDKTVKMERRESRKEKKVEKRSLNLNFSRRLPNSRYLLDTASKTYKRGFLRTRRKDVKEISKHSKHRKTKSRNVNNSSLSSHDSNFTNASRISQNSNSVSNSNSESEDREGDIDMLTRMEERSNELKNKEDRFLLYTENGHPVEVYFGFDYLQINDKICFYEDMASWTNDKKCLKITYVKHKDMPEQERVEIKLYVVDKEYQGKATPSDLNELLRKKIAILLCDKMKINFKEAMDLLSKEATEREVMKVVEKIDISSERCLAGGYTRDI